MAGNGTDQRVQEPEDWGYNYPASYVERTFSIWYRTDFKVMPRAGGLDDQDPAWIEDMELCLLLLEFQKQPDPENALSEFLFGKTL